MKHTLSSLIVSTILSCVSHSASLYVDTTTYSDQIGQSNAIQEVTFRAEFSDKVANPVGTTNGHFFIDRKGAQISLPRQADTTDRSGGINRHFRYITTIPYVDATGENQAWSGSGRFKFKINLANEPGFAFFDLPEHANYSSAVSPLLIDSLGSAAKWSTWETSYWGGGILWGHSQGPLVLNWNNVNADFVSSARYTVLIYSLDSGNIVLYKDTWNWSSGVFETFTAINSSDLSNFANGDYLLQIFASPRESGVGDGWFGGTNPVLLTDDSGDSHGHAQTQTQHSSVLTAELRIVNVIQNDPTISILSEPNGSIVVSYTGILQSTHDLSLPFVDVVGATSPYTVPAFSPSRFFFRARSE